MLRTLQFTVLILLVLLAQFSSAAPRRYHATAKLRTSPIVCVKQKEAGPCDDIKGCTWCEGANVGTGCYPKAAAKLLPSKHFKCNKDLTAVRGGSGRRGYRADTCDKLSEAHCLSPACIWCTSAAVGGGCYTPAQAKLLPSAIFKCKNTPTESRA